MLAWSISPNHIWLIKSASSTSLYQQARFAHPVVEEGASTALGIGVVTTLPSSSYDPIS